MRSYVTESAINTMICTCTASVCLCLVPSPHPCTARIRMRGAARRGVAWRAVAPLLPVHRHCRPLPRAVVTLLAATHRANTQIRNCHFSRGHRRYRNDIVSNVEVDAMFSTFDYNIESMMLMTKNYSFPGLLQRRLSYDIKNDSSSSSNFEEEISYWGWPPYQ